MLEVLFYISLALNAFFLWCLHASGQELNTRQAAIDNYKAILGEKVPALEALITNQQQQLNEFRERFGKEDT